MFESFTNNWSEEWAAFVRVFGGTAVTLPTAYDAETVPPAATDWSGILLLKNGGYTTVVTVNGKVLETKLLPSDCTSMTEIVIFAEPALKGRGVIPRVRIF